MCKYCTTNFRERDRYVLPIKKQTLVGSTGINVDSISLTGDGYTVITFTNDKIFKKDGELERLIMAYTVNFNYCPFCGRELKN